MPFRSFPDVGFPQENFRHFLQHVGRGGEGGGITGDAKNARDFAFDPDR